MAESNLQGNIMHELGELKKVVFDMKHEIDFIKDVMEDRILSDEDKKAIDETLKAEKAGKLKSMEDVFG